MLFTLPRLRVHYQIFERCSQNFVYEWALYEISTVDLGLNCAARSNDGNVILVKGKKPRVFYPTSGILNHLFLIDKCFILMTHFSESDLWYPDVHDKRRIRALRSNPMFNHSAGVCFSNVSIKWFLLISSTISCSLIEKTDEALMQQSNSCSKCVRVGWLGFDST